MKNKFVFLFIFVIFSISLVSSLGINMKNTTQLGENIVVRISGNFQTPLTLKNIAFLRKEYLPTTMAPVSLTKVNGDYYFYLNIPLEKVSDNYTMKISGIKYMKQGKWVMDPVEKNFTIINKTVPFTINPAFVIGNNSVTLYLTNMVPNKDLKIYTVNETKTLIEINSPNSDSSGFLSTLFKSNTNSTNSTNKTNSSVTTITKSPLANQTIILKDGALNQPVKIQAPLTAGFKTINFYYNDKAYGVLAYFPNNRTTPAVENKKDNSSVNNTKFTNLSINNNTNLTLNNQTNRTIVQNSDAENCSQLNSIKNITSVPMTNNSLSCNGTTYITLSQKCCNGNLINPNKSSSSGKTIGWILFIAIIIGIIWFVKKKYSRAGPGKVDFSKKK